MKPETEIMMLKTFNLMQEILLDAAIRIISLFKLNGMVDKEEKIVKKQVDAWLEDVIKLKKLVKEKVNMNKRNCDLDALAPHISLLIQEHEATIADWNPETGEDVRESVAFVRDFFENRGYDLEAELGLDIDEVPILNKDLFLEEE